MKLAEGLAIVAGSRPGGTALSDGPAWSGFHATVRAHMASVAAASGETAR
ncbi:hypothetical protein [Aquibium microcysteis]|nr:hypothetical protein [Aquibium microcysteis]